MANDVIFINDDFFNGVSRELEEIAKSALIDDDVVGLIDQKKISRTRAKITSTSDVDDEVQLSEDLSMPQQSLLSGSSGNPEFFNCEMFSSAFKDDTKGMGIPIFTMNQNEPDLSVCEWHSDDGKSHVFVYPSVLGRATQLDKDILIYAISQLVDGLNKGKINAGSRTIRFKVYDYLKATGKQTNGSEYAKVPKRLMRLKGTMLTTNIKTDNIRIKGGFGLIDEFTIVEKTTSKGEDVILAVEMVLSRWMFNAISAMQVKTLNPLYFKLRKPTERKLYEIASAYCYNDKSKKIRLDLLLGRVGLTCTIVEFRRVLREIIADNKIPDYRFSLIDKDNVLIENLSNQE